MLFLKELLKTSLFISLFFAAYIVLAQESVDQTGSNSTETLILEQDNETLSNEILSNEPSSKWDFIEHDENEPSDVDDVAEDYSEDSFQVNDYDAITIYIDASWGSRTDRAAEKITESHKEYATQGYKVIDVDLYLENSDLKGFFVTYER